MSIKPKSNATGPINRKLAETISTKIEEEIIRTGWKVGELLGKESELAERYGVGRWIMREALGIAERDGLIEIRRGRNGGVVISAPAIDAIGSTIRNYLRVCRITPAEIYEARLVLETLAIVLASQHLNEGKAQRLREVYAKAKDAPEDSVLEHITSMTRALLLATDNTALLIFSYVLVQVTTDIAVHLGVLENRIIAESKQLIELRRAQFESVIAGDVTEAQSSAEQFLQTTITIGLKFKGGTSSKRLLEAPAKLLADPFDEKKPNGARPKLTEQLTHRLQMEIIINNWPAGHHLGTESELMQKYNVSRAVFREAVRPLERLGLLEMRRGRDFGLKTSVPDPISIIRSTSRFLSYAKLKREGILELLRVIEKTIAKNITTLTAAKRVKAAEALRATLAIFNQPISVETQSEHIRNVYHQIANTTENRILGLYLRILIEALLDAKKSSAKATKNMSDALLGATEALAESFQTAEDSLIRFRIAAFRESVID